MSSINNHNSLLPLFVNQDIKSDEKKESSTQEVINNTRNVFNKNIAQISSESHVGSADDYVDYETEEENLDYETEEEIFEEKTFNETSNLESLSSPKLEITQRIKEKRKGSESFSQGIINGKRNAFNKTIGFTLSYPLDPSSPVVNTKTLKFHIEKVNEKAIKETNAPFFSFKNNRSIKNCTPLLEHTLTQGKQLKLNLHSKRLSLGCEYRVRIIEGEDISILDANIVAVSHKWASNPAYQAKPIVNGLYNSYCIKNSIENSSNLNSLNNSRSTSTQQDISPTPARRHFVRTNEQSVPITNRQDVIDDNMYNVPTSLIINARFHPYIALQRNPFSRMISAPRAFGQQAPSTTVRFVQQSSGIIYNAIPQANNGIN